MAALSWGSVSAAGTARGVQIACMLSAETGPVSIELVRFVHGGTNPAGPGFRSGSLTAVAPWQMPAGVQHTYPGSCMLAPDVVPAGTPSVRFSVWAWPTMPVAPASQGLLSLVSAHGSPGLSVVLDTAGHLPGGDCAGGVRDRLVRPLRKRRWYRLTGTVGAGGCELTAAPVRPGRSRTGRS